MKLNESDQLSKREKNTLFSFIIGTGRCGTTVLAQMLNSHSKVCVPSEIQILFEHSKNGLRFFEVFNSGMNLQYCSEDFIKLVEMRCPHNLQDFFDYRTFFEKQSYPILNLKEFISSFYQEIAETHSKSMFIEQTPWYGQRIDIVNDLFPHARYIHMVRDARDVAISFARTPWWSKDIGRNLQRWHDEVNRIVTFSQRILKTEQILMVRYEDLINSPEDELYRICKHLQIDFQEGMLDPETFIDYGVYRKNPSQSIFSKPLNKWTATKNSPVFQESRYAWKKYTNYDFRSIPQHIKESLELFGYET